MAGETGLARAKAIYANREGRVRQLKAQGKQVVGYLCCFPPLEFMTALDLVPYRILGDVNEPIEKSDEYLEDITCPFIRSSMDLALKGRHDFMEVFVDVHSCDSCEKVYDIWRNVHNYPHTHFIEVPHSYRNSAKKFFKQELIRFQYHLEEIAGKTITQDRLLSAINLHNEQRALMRKLYDFKKSNPPTISATETVQVWVAVNSLPVEEGNALLREAIAEIGSRKAVQSGDKAPRLFLWGGPVNSTELFEMIEGCGIDIVIDDVCTGTKSFINDVQITGDDLLDGIANRYFDGINCARNIHDRLGSYKEHVETRFGYMRQLINEYQANGALMAVISYCDPMEYEAPEVLDYLEGLGLQVLHIEYDYSVNAFGALKTRIEAFKEMLNARSAT